MAQERVRGALARLLRSEGLSLAELGRQLSQRSSDLALGGRQGRATRYDTAAVQRWLSGTQPMSRQGAWLLDRLYPRAESTSFQDLRDQYVLAKDRAAVPHEVESVPRLLLEGARCVADQVALSFERRPMPIAPDERLAFVYVTVIDNDESRAAIRLMTEAFAGVTLLALYDVLGRWDVVVIVALSRDVELAAYGAAVREALIDAEMTASADDRDSGDATVDEARLREFTAQRAVAVDVSLPIIDASGARPEHLLLATNDDYRLLRVQRGILFIELQTVAPPRREILRDRLTGCGPRRSRRI